MTRRIIEIKPTRGLTGIPAGELWSYRYLFGILMWRDLLIRYRETLLGVAWAVLQPATTAVILAFIFGKFPGIVPDPVPYPLFVYSALVLWFLFAQGVTRAADSLVDSQGLITKVYFPRLLVPAAVISSCIVDFAVSCVPLLVAIPYYGVAVSMRLLTLPLILILTIESALAVGIWFAALNVKFRDLRYVVPFITQFWMFATPVVYPASLIGPQWTLVYGLNPMAGAIEGFRWALLGTQYDPWPLILLGFVVATAALVTGAVYFRNTEKLIADII